MSGKNAATLVVGTEVPQGQAIVDKLVADGHAVVGCRRLYAGSEPCSALSIRGATMASLSIQPLEEASVESLFKSVLGVLGRLDNVVIVQGREVPVDVLTCSFDQWRSALSVTLDISVLCARYAAHFMGDRSDKTPGHIVFAVSDGSVSEHPFDVPGTAACWGVRGLARNIALNLAPQNILVNVVATGEDENLFSAAAETVAFLVSDDAQNVTGSVLTVNDGVTML